METAEVSMEQRLSFSSISEIHTAILQGTITPTEGYNFFQESRNKIKGSESAFHNLGVEFMRHECTPYALDVLLLGIEYYPMSTTLLADLVKYSQETGDIDKCEKGVDKLLDIDRKFWTWRTFVFAIDYLKDSIKLVSNEEKYEQNVILAQKLIKDFKKYLPHEERAYIAESELYETQSEYKKAINALQAGIRKVKVAPQCCLKLSDYWLERGEYDKVVNTARLGIIASAQDQPTCSTAYLCYQVALALDAKWWSRKNDNNLCNDDFNEIIKSYRIADRLFAIEGRDTVSYRNTIRLRTSMLLMENDLANSNSTLTDLNKSAVIDKEVIDKINNALGMHSNKVNHKELPALLMDDSSGDDWSE